MKKKIKVEVYDEHGDVVDTYIEELDFLPRKGEFLEYKGDLIEVARVHHSSEEEPTTFINIDLRDNSRHIPGI